jgi:hypothetical protein
MTNAMLIRSYLNATRGDIQFIDNDKNSFPHYVKAIDELFRGDNIKVCFIRSPACKTEFITIDGARHFIIDRQSDLYFNALAHPTVLSENDESERIELLFGALTYVAANELFYCGRPLLASKALEAYGRGRFYNAPVDFCGEMCRLHFSLFHEWGHTIVKEGKEVAKAVLAETDLVFSEHVDELTQKACADRSIAKNIYYRTRYTEQFQVNNRVECAVDLLAALRMKEMLDSVVEVKLATGGIPTFLKKSLIAIHQHEMIEDIRHIVKRAIAGAKYEERDQSILIQRMRVTRQIFNRLMVDLYGIDGARSFHNEFYSYLVHFDRPCKKELYEQLHNFIAANREIFNEQIEPELNSERCVKLFEWV